MDIERVSRDGKRECYPALVEVLALPKFNPPQLCAESNLKHSRCDYTSTSDTSDQEVSDNPIDFDMAVLLLLLLSPVGSPDMCMGLLLRGWKWMSMKAGDRTAMDTAVVKHGKQLGRPCHTRSSRSSK